MTLASLLGASESGAAPAHEAASGAPETPPPAPSVPSSAEPAARGTVDVSPRDSAQPPPVHVAYASYGGAFVGSFLFESGPTCADAPEVPCILGSGGGLAIRGGYRSAGPWYIGGAYQFLKTSSANLYRLPIVQQLRAEMRYVLDLGYRLSPYATWGLGGFIYGNEFGAETGGATVLAGLGVEMQLSRVASVGLALVYQPMLFAGWTDSANFERETGVAHFVGLEFQLEVRSEIEQR